MGCIFKAVAYNTKTGKQIKAEVFIGGKNHGFTSDKKDSHIIIEKETVMDFTWYIKYNNVKIGSGKSKGGLITGYHSPS